MKRLIILLGILLILCSCIEIKQAYGTHKYKGYYYINIWLGDNLIISQKTNIKEKIK